MRGLAILLAEDHVVNAHLLIEELEYYGAHVVHALDGRATCDKAFGPRRPDVILMDCQMPEVDGFEAARRIRAVEAEHGMAAVPIIALTGLSQEFEEQHSYTSGMNAYLVKPFSTYQLAAAIGRLLPRAAASDEGREGVTRPPSPAGQG